MQTVWTVKGGRVVGPAPFIVAGILNVTPDSFFDGGKHDSTRSAVEAGLSMHGQGADIIDVGGESTRPGAQYVPAGREKDRVLPVVRELLEARPELVISIDTYKAEVAREALDAGVAVVNDISGYSFDNALRDVVVQYKPGYVLMHTPAPPGTMQESPAYSDVVGELLDYFEKKMNQLVRSGLPEDRIVIDPGIGFGKNLEHNLAILRHIERFVVLGRPVYMGLSNKSLWGDLLGLAKNERSRATQVATALLAARGVGIHRVHEVQATRQTLAIVQAMS
ncbi:dihydropteroate synthase [Desulfoplanes formicivorans]|uniref:Dihydropteroate synthase n=2 Tax=Desulfoplanes formicivorans TaxID=1592317 RepID=A0A194AG12_9BACT|nr:dihydropteroate synthase [Desulfoplanes formicivorans]